MVRRGRAQVVRPRWTGNLVTAVQSTTATNITYVDIVAVGDYQQGTTLEAGSATLMRIRGNVYFYSATVGALFFAAIYVIDGDLNPAVPSDMDPTSIRGLINGDMLWMTSGLAPLMTNGEPRNVEIDVRVKRKLENSKAVLVVGAEAQTVLWGFHARALVKSV